jgi:WS/DGAT/MGAT family acyltransferase
MSTIEWMNPMDAGFLQVETDTQPMHVGSMLIMDGPPPTYEEFCRHVGTRLGAVPRYRQRVRRPPLNFARPYWVDDPHFSLHYHVRHTAIPQPGTEHQLRALAGRIMSQRLDLARPLWEMWLIEGLQDQRWAVVSKVHHAMIDGVSGHEILEIMLDRDAAASRPHDDTWQPRPEPTRGELFRESAAWVGRLPGAVWQGASSAVTQPRVALREVGSRTAGIAKVGSKVTGAHGVLSGPIGPHRLWSWARGDLDDVKTVKAAVGCTVNDVVLAAIAGGYRTFLLTRGEVLEDETVRSLVPVSIRNDAQRGRLGNQVTAMFADLPIGVSNPVERLGVVAGQMHRLKTSGESVGVKAMVDVAEFVPPTLMSLAARVTTAVGQHLFDTVTTNIPGPQVPLFMLGRQLREMFPYIPIADGARVSIGIVSYHGQLTFAATGDYDSMPDLDVLTASIEESLRELVGAVTD